MAPKVVDQHIQLQARIRDRATAAMGAAWQRLPAYNEENIPAWLNVAVPITLAAQRASVASTSAYVAHALRLPRVVPDVAKVLAGVRGGADPREVYKRPMVAVWTGLANGDQWKDAVAAGGARATSAVAMDVALAQRGTMQTIQDTQDVIAGYRRVADSGACEFCQAVDGAFLKNADAMGLHPSCGCTIEPITRSEPVTPTPDTVAVREHGELGALLTSPGDHFTGPGQI